MAKLSAYMSEAGDRALPDDVVEKAKHHILDTFAAMVSGSDLPPARAAYTFASSYTHDSSATIVASTMTSDPLVAALVNGMLAHSDETDDSNEFSQSHPGCAIVPAAFAAGEKFGVGGTRFLRAVTLGYDIGPRVTLSFGHRLPQHQSQEHARHRRRVWCRSGRGVRRQTGCAADALGARLHGPAILRHRRMDPRHRSYREVVRVRRHART